MDILVRVSIQLLQCDKLNSIKIQNCTLHILYNNQLSFLID